MFERIAAVDGNNCLHKLYHAMGAQGAAKFWPVQLAALTDRICDGNAAAVSIAFDASDGTQWRRDLVPEYKGKRKPKDPELAELLKRAPEFAFDRGYDCYTVAGNEADDVIAAIVKRNAASRVVMVSEDSDLRQLLEPGRVSQLIKFNTERGIITKEVYYTAADFVNEYGIRPAQLPAWKALAGDKSDNLRARVNAETASAILKRFATLADATRDQWAIPCNARQRVAIMNAARSGELDNLLQVTTLRRDCLDFVYMEGGA